MPRIALEEAFGIPGVETKVSSMRRSVFYDPAAVARWNDNLTEFTDLRLGEMDENGIDLQVLSLTAPGIQAETDPAVAVEHARRANDFLAGVVAEYPGRFAGFAALPLQNPDAAVRELERAVRELGFVGALVNGHTNGVYLDDPRFAPVWAALENLDVPLYLHPGAPPLDKWLVTEGHPYLTGPTWQWGAETAAHALRLIYAAVFDDFPKARLILGHMGEFLPFQIARLDARYEFMTMPRPLAKGRPGKYIGENILITTTGVCSHAALVGAILAIGVDSIMFSVDYPFECTDKAVEFLDTAPLADADRDKIAYLNAARLLRLDKFLPGA